MHTKTIIYSILLNQKTFIQINTAKRKVANQPKPTKQTQIVKQHESTPISIQALNTRNKHPTNKTKQANNYHNQTNQYTANFQQINKTESNRTEKLPSTN